MAPPSMLKQLCGFIGMVNSYRTMLHHHAHMMAPLMQMTKLAQKLFEQSWGPDQDKAFTAVKAFITEDGPGFSPPMFSSVSWEEGRRHIVVMPD